MRVLLAALRCGKGELETNLASHLRVVAEARAAGCDLAVFPEMSLTGSADPGTHPGRLIGLDHPAVARLAGASGDGLAVCFGIAERDASGAARITQLFAASGEIAGLQRMRHLGDGEEAFVPAT